MSEIALYIDFGDGEWKQIELPAGTTIARTRQVNDLGSAENRQADFTPQFKAPKSQQNRIHFENAHLVNSNTDIPYSKLRAKLSQYGRETLGYCIFEMSAEDYELTFYTGNADFFFQLEGIMLSDIPFDDLDHFRAFDIIFGLATQQSGTVQANDNRIDPTPAGRVIYPVIDYNTRTVTSGVIDTHAMENVSRKVYCDRLFPALYTKEIVARILSHVNYTATGDVLSRDEYTNEIIPFSGESLQRNERIDKRVNRTFIMNVPASVPATTGFPGYLLINHSLIQQVVYNNSTFHHPYFVTQFIDSFKARVQVTITLSSTSPFSRDMSIGLNSFGNLGFVTIPANTTVTKNYDIDHAYAAGDNLELKVFCTNTSSVPNVSVDAMTATVTYKTSLNTTDDSIIIYGGETGAYGVNDNQWLTVSSLLPNISVKDFLKDLATRYGITFITHPERRVIEFRLFNELAENKINAPDWSSKVTEDADIKLQYRFGNYSQINHTRWKPDPTVPEKLGYGSIIIHDTNLPPSADLFIQQFAASETVKLLQGIDIARIPKFVFDAAQNTVVMSGKTEQRILFAEWQTVSLMAIPINFYSSDPGLFGGNSITTHGPFAGTFFVAAEKNYTMSFADYLLPTFYPVLISILSKPKQPTVPMNISVDDFLTFDHFMPIFLNVTSRGAKINGYFYINIVENYQAGQTCFPVLIKI